MRRVIIGMLIGISATLAVQFTYRHLTTPRLHELSALDEWQSETLPSLLGSRYAYETGMTSQEFKWPPHTEFYSVILYEKTNMLKAIRVPTQMSNGVFSFPSAEEIRVLDENAACMPVPPIRWMTNDCEVAYNSFRAAHVDKKFLNIHNKSGLSFVKFTVKRGNGPTLTIDDLADGSTRGAFITFTGEENKIVALRGHLPSGNTCATNFTVVSAARKKDVDVTIDASLRFHVTEKEK